MDQVVGEIDCALDIAVVGATTVGGQPYRFNGTFKRRAIHSHHSAQKRPARPRSPSTSSDRSVSADSTWLSGLRLHSQARSIKMCHRRRPLSQWSGLLACILIPALRLHNRFSMTTADPLLRILCMQTLFSRSSACRPSSRGPLRHHHHQSTLHPYLIHTSPCLTQPHTCGRIEQDQHRSPSGVSSGQARTNSGGGAYTGTS